MASAGVIAHSRPLCNPLPSISPSHASAIFFILLRLATPALRLGVLAASWLLFGGFRATALLSYVRSMGSPGIAVLYRIAFLVHVSLDFGYCLVLKFGSAPDPFGGRGGWPLLHLLVVHVPSCWTAQSKRTYVVHQTLSLCVPVQV